MIVGLIGAGNIGSQVVRLAVAAGHEVVVSNSRAPETLAELGPRAFAGTARDAAERGEIVAGDDVAAKETVTRLLDQFGFDTVDAGPLSEGWRIQRDTPGYGPRRPAAELRDDLAAAMRYAER